jgi:hypothetical protein
MSRAESHRDFGWNLFWRDHWRDEIIRSWGGSPPVQYANVLFACFGLLPILPLTRFGWPRALRVLPRDLIPLFQCLDRHCERQHEGERRIEETRRAVAFVPLRGMIAFGVDQQSHAAHFLRGGRRARG